MRMVRRLARAEWSSAPRIEGGFVISKIPDPHRTPPNLEEGVPYLPFTTKANFSSGYSMPFSLGTRLFSVNGLDGGADLAT
jgi:hypothetical protein